MSAAATAPPATPEPSHAGRLLNLVRRLIEYGKELAATIRQRAVTDPTSTITCFGTTDVALILARINHGLHRANELEARVLRGATHLDAKQAPANSRSERKAPAASPTEPTNPRVVCLPTPARIAAEVRRRPIGAVIADICRDLGILPCHPLWRELQIAIIRHNGNYAGLMKDIFDRAFSPPAPHSSVGAPAALRRPTLRYAAPSCTGPP
jgi:hypothetical protein